MNSQTMLLKRLTPTLCMWPWQTIHFSKKKTHAVNASVNRGGAAGFMAWVHGRAFVTLRSPLRKIMLQRKDQSSKLADVS